MVDTGGVGVAPVVENGGVGVFALKKNQIRTESD